VVPFDAHPRAPFTGAGNDPAMLAGLRAQVDALASNGGTDMYAALARALELLTEQPELSDAFPAIVLMTDGRSQGRREGPAGPAGEWRAHSGVLHHLRRRR
jgi:Ca-activated chloride channel family protein